jgi:cephalosporin-C deacetylase-like acetyl esterase
MIVKFIYQNLPFIFMLFFEKEKNMKIGFVSYIKRILSICLFLCLIIIHIDIQGKEKDELTVLTLKQNFPQSEEMMRSYLRRLSHEALDRRLENYEAMKTPEQVHEYQKEMRQFFLKQLNLPHKKTPLNAQIIGKKTYQNYKIEKVIFESQPGFYVTAILYLPLTKPPYPGVLIVCGHDKTGKIAYQKIGMLLAQNGIAALCQDPIGQGERNQLLDDKGHAPYRATSEHMIEGIAPILLGRSIATYMIWDGIRGIDYLISRPEIDSTRIGCAGNSGGGNRTSYLMALDERIVSAAPGCFITTTRLKNEKPGPGDAEQNIHAQIVYGMDLPDYIIMHAPKPSLILSATQDFVPIEGAWEAFRQAKRIYTRLGYSERIDLIEADEKHGLTKHLRAGAVRWMRRWLLNIDDVVTDNDYNLEPDEELQCSPDGQVLLIPGARSVFDLNIEKEKQLAKQRKKFWAQTKRKSILKKIHDITGIRKLENLPKVTKEDRGTLIREEYTIQKIVIKWESNIELPALLFRPDNPNEEYYLYVNDNGKSTDTGPGSPIEKLVHSGNVVMAVDLRGIGETRTSPWRYKQAHEFTGSDVAEFYIAYMLNKSFLSMRTEDILVSAGILTDLISQKKQARIHLIAIGETGPPALHAAALNPDLFASFILRESLVSWSDVVNTPVTRGSLVNTVHGALQTYDLPDLIALIGPERITIENPINAQGEIIDTDK